MSAEQADPTSRLQTGGNKRQREADFGFVTFSFAYVGSFHCCLGLFVSSLFCSRCFTSLDFAACLPHDAMHKCSLSHHAACVRPSVCLSVTFVHSVEISFNILIFFHHRIATPF